MRRRGGGAARGRGGSSGGGGGGGSSGGGAAQPGNLQSLFARQSQMEIIADVSTTRPFLDVPSLSGSASRSHPANEGGQRAVVGPTSFSGAGASCGGAG